MSRLSANCRSLRRPLGYRYQELQRFFEKSSSFASVAFTASVVPSFQSVSCGVEARAAMPEQEKDYARHADVLDATRRSTINQPGPGQHQQRAALRLATTATNRPGPLRPRVGRYSGERPLIGDDGGTFPTADPPFPDSLWPGVAARSYPYRQCQRGRHRNER